MQTSGWGWTTQQISDYVSQFPENVRDYILRELMSGKILREFLDRPEGKLILDSTVESIAANVMNMVNICTSSGFENHLMKLREEALNINVCFNFMKGIAQKLTVGEEREKSMKGQ